jgi:predicted transcriptional regulator
MKLSDVVDTLKADLLTEANLATHVGSVEAADLLSDVLAWGKPGMLLLTGLVSPQVIRTAVVADLCGVVLVRGKRPSDSMLRLAREEAVPLLCTPLTAFEAAGLLDRAVTRE